jgi:hypothetical protein
MKLLGTLLSLTLLFAAQPMHAGSVPSAPVGDKIKPSVEYAKTWEAAVEEAKLLNVPIVVHSHGFY